MLIGKPFVKACLLFVLCFSQLKHGYDDMYYKYYHKIHTLFTEETPRMSIGRERERERGKGREREREREGERGKGKGKGREREYVCECERKCECESVAGAEKCRPWDMNYSFFENHNNIILRWQLIG